MKISNIKPWLGLLLAIPFIFIVLWMEGVPIGRNEIIIVFATVIAGFGFLYLVKRNSDKKEL